MYRDHGNPTQISPTHLPPTRGNTRQTPFADVPRVKADRHPYCHHVRERSRSCRGRQPQQWTTDHHEPMVYGDQGESMGLRVANSLESAGSQLALLHRVSGIVSSGTPLVKMLEELIDLVVG